MKPVIVLTLGAALLAACTTAPRDRPTYEQAGRVYFETGCRAAASLVSGGPDSADGLPKKGQTDHDRVHRLLPQVEANFSGLTVVAVNVIRRNGEVWSDPGDGVFTVEQADDYQYEVVLGPEGTCPDAPLSVNGVPVLFTRRG